MNQPVILFDIDNTLLDTKAFSQEAFEKVRLFFNISYEDHIMCKDAYYATLLESTDFRPEEYITFVAARILENFNDFERNGLQDVLAKSFYNSDLIRSHMYEDVTRNMRRLKSGFTLGIYSEGSLMYQRIKVESMGLNSFLEDIFCFIFNRKSAPENIERIVGSIDAKTIVVDDKQKYLNALVYFEIKQSFQRKKSIFEPIWICRDQNAVSEQSSKEILKGVSKHHLKKQNLSQIFPTISSLDELKKQG